jgi:lysophospholipase L1-like esterase
VKSKRGRIGAAIIGIALLILIGGEFVQRYWLEWPVGSGPAGPAVSRERFRSVWTRRPVLLVGIGDSITAGFGASDRAHSYFGRLATNPRDEFPEMKGICLKTVLPNLRTLNLAAHGSDSADHLKRQIPRLPEASKETLGIVVMTSGGNDLIHDYGRSAPRECAMYGATLAQARPWIANYQKRLDTMIRQIESRFPGGCRIFLADIYDPTDGDGAAWTAGLPRWPDSLRILEAYNAAIRRCVAWHPSVHLVPIREMFLGHGIYCRQFWRSTYRPEDPHYWYSSNFEDPNDRGYDALRRLFLNKIAESFEQGQEMR